MSNLPQVHDNPFYVLQLNFISRYGARRLEDNIIAMILAVGSPVLAAYSLVLTLLNGRWVAERFSNIRYRQYRRACRIIAALQQAPLCLSTENHHLALLVVLPINDGWWKDCLDRLSVSHTWSIAAATSISWVLIAYLFTVAQSFQSLAPLPFSNNVSDGQAIGTVWLWLLPTVVGWLQISPKCDSHYLEHIFEKANEHAYEDQGINGLPPTKNRSPAFSMYKSNLNSMDTQGGHAICTAPIFNYARIFTWTQQTETVRSMFLAAANKRNAEAAAHNSPCRENFTSDQALDYCSSKELRSHWGPGIWKRIILASVAALYLQWGTASASIIIQYFTPTVGLGCRSASVLLYAASSTLVWLFLTTSSILSHSASPHHPSLTLDCSTSRTQSDSATASKRFLRLLASIMRTLGVMIAVLNAIQFVISSGLQFGGIYSNCWCESVKLTLGLEAYVTVLIRDNDLRSPWIGGVVLGISTVVIFTLGTSLFYNPEIDPRERDNEM